MINTTWANNTPGSELGTTSTSLVGSSFNLNAAFVNASSGTALAIRLTSPVNQTSGTMDFYIYLTGKTGTPTSTTFALYAGPSGVMDAQRPDTGSPIASVIVDVSGQSLNTWTTASFTGITLVRGTTYWLVIHNTTGTPASNYASFMSRGTNAIVIVPRMPAWTTTNGFTTDPTVVSSLSEAPVVFAFDDGSTYGAPTVASTVPTTNANDRGTRFRFPVNVTITGALWLGLSNTNLTHVKIYQGSTEVGSLTLDRSAIFNAQTIYFNSDVTFTAGLDYDVVGKFSGSTNVGHRYHAGSSPPADVSACLTANMKYVNGATPGSYTVEEGMCSGIYLLVQEYPASSGQRSYCH